MFKSVLDFDGLPKDESLKSAWVSISNSGAQFESGFQSATYSSITINHQEIKNIVFCGMGGSNLAAKLISSLSPFLLPHPFEISSNYRLPSYVNKNTLVILCSYSGNTEEVMSMSLDAVRRQAQTIFISSGGKLADYAIQNHHNFIKIETDLNSSKAPRYGLFLLIGACFGLIKRLFPENTTEIDTQKIHLSIEKSLDLVRVEKNVSKNSAKDMAIKYQNKAVVFIGANHLASIGQIIKNYLNESAKTFAFAYEIPDSNHHLLDGLVYPSSFKDNLYFFLINSELYPSVIQKRLKITQDIIIKQGYQLTVVKPESDSLIGQTMESLVFFIVFSYYLSVVNKVDPIKTPYVDYFKNHL